MTNDPASEIAILRRELAETVQALLAERQSDYDERVCYLVKVPAQRGWHRHTKETYPSEALALEVANIAAIHHSKARVVERRSFIRERVLQTIEAGTAETAGLGPQDESAVGNAETPTPGPHHPPEGE